MSMQAMIDEWYPVGLFSQLDAAGRSTALMGEPIRVACNADGEATVTGGNGRALPVLVRYGHVWSSLGEPKKDIFPIPEADQPGRRFVDVGVVRVRCSPLRAVENFLDIAHFPFVHTDILGAEPHTEVPELQGGDPRRCRRGLGDAGEILPAAGGQVGERRHYDRIHVPRAGADLLGSLQDLPAASERMGCHHALRAAAGGGSLRCLALDGAVR